MLNIEDIWKVPQNVAATERARESSQRAEATMQQNMANQKRNLSMAESKSEIETQQKKVEVAYGKLNFARRMLSTVKDDETLKRARDQYLTIYPEDRENVDRVMPGKYSKNFVDMAKAEIRAMAATIAPLTISEGQKVVDPVTMEELASGGAKQASKTQLNKLISERNALAAGDPQIELYDQAISKHVSTTGERISFSKEGGLVIERGELGKASGNLSMKTKGAIEQGQLARREQLARLGRIEAAFKPEYQELGTRLGHAWTGTKAWLGMDVSEEDRATYNKYTKFQRTAIENINLYIKEITGAQMSEKEADRLKLAQPDPGEKFWKGDDPIKFQSKMDDIRESNVAGIARYDHYRKEGFTHDQIEMIVGSDASDKKLSADFIPIDKFMKKAKASKERSSAVLEKKKRRAQEISASLKLKLPNSSEDERDLMVIERLKEEF